MTRTEAIGSKDARSRVDWANFPVGVVLIPTLFFVVLLTIWELAVRLGDVHVLMLPAPSVIWVKFVEDFDILVELARNTGVESAKGVLVGSVIAITLAALVHGIRWLNQGLLSYSSTVKALPVVALYPVMTVFFGVTSKAVVAMVCVGVAPIMFTFASRGFSGTSEHDDLMRSISAGWLTRMTALVLPRALPYVMAGLRTAVPLSIIIAIISEYFGGSVSTLGAYIRRESTMLHTVQVWSAIVMACLLGVLVFVAVSMLDRYFLRWHASRQEA
ncbi:MAG: hypothetical protein CL464_08450 [Acidimicrobiaceae bacterium]|nr:hypothetical protein [Acidimicrobiaceae bacterium]|tara:strand:- start:1593 stop:2411 length:819 start_codon:yes stop_codon:yes gene_type:complete